MKRVSPIIQCSMVEISPTFEGNDVSKSFFPEMASPLVT